MRIRVLFGGILIVISIIAGAYSYLWLTDKELGAETDLFSLVPESSIAILETNNVSELMQNISQLEFAQEYDSLKFSDLLNFLKTNIDLLKANTAHGLSPQMNQILISFHGTGDARDQVLYGKLASGDGVLIENLIEKNYNSTSLARTSEYKGEEIIIYPLNNNNFLACYFKSGFYAVSYQKKLIEDVIDARLHKKSILNDSIFTQFIENRKSYSPAMLYLKGQNIPLGKQTKENGRTLRFARWTAFNINMNGNALYLSGSCLDSDTCVSFENMLKSQTPIGIFPSKYLPATNSFFYQMAISDFAKALSHITRKNYPPAHSITPIEKNDSAFRDFLIKYGGEELRFLMFHDYNASATLRKIMSIQLNNAPEAEKRLNLYTLYAPIDKKECRMAQKTFRINEKQFRTFVLPKNTIFAQFSSNPDYGLNTYGCFYEGNLLVAPNDSCIYSYIHQIESGNTMEGNQLYDKCMSGLSSESNYLSLADMEDAITYPDIYERLIPSFYFKHPDFFRNFIITIQFTCVNGESYPYLVLMYKGKRDQQNISIPSKVK